jgi:hypothetical protein
MTVSDVRRLKEMTRERIAELQARLRSEAGESALPG